MRGPLPFAFLCLWGYFALRSIPEGSTLTHIGLFTSAVGFVLMQWYRRRRAREDAAMADPEQKGQIEGRWERAPIDGEPIGRPYTRTSVHVDRPCRPYSASPEQKPRCEENRGGDFYTDCETCLTCDVPHIVAPDLMAYVVHAGKGWGTHCVFTRQPRTPEEIDRAIDAMCESEVCAIRYGGSDPAILARIAARGSGALGSADRPPSPT